MVHDTLRHEARRPGAPPAPRARLGPIRWERIQLMLRLRALGEPIEPYELRLARIEPEEPVEPHEPVEPMAPTWAARDGDEVVARFNVMLGPGQRPLASGRWVLAAAERPIELVDPDPIEAFLAERTFAYRGGRYRVSPAIPRGEAHLVLDIHSRRRRPRRSIFTRREWRRRAKQQRDRIFRAMLGWHRARAPRDGRRILFTSDSHAGLAGNLATVYERMVERGLDREYVLETLFKPSIATGRSWRDRWRLPRLLAQSDVILLDDYQPSVYHLEPVAGQRIVQLWHASGAFKTVGYSRIGKPGGPSPFARRHKNYTHAIVSGRHDAPYYAEAFGLPEERVVPTGIPRMDRFFDEAHRTAGRERAALAFPAIEGRFTILFAPTFRGIGPRDAHYDYGRLDWEALHALAVAKDAVVIVKMHPFVREPAPIPDALRDRIIDGTAAPIDVNDLLFAVDLLVTDYSSIVFEFSTLQRPMLFYAYDLEEYVASRDFYVPFAEFVPGRIVRTSEELIDAIRNDDYEAEKVSAFAERHFDHLDAGATDRVIDQLILGR